MKRKPTRIPYLAAASLAACCLAANHTGHAAVVTGQVLDGTTGQPLSGVQVFADGASTGATTDATGKFQVDLAAGEKVLALKKDGFIEQSLGKIEIAAEGEQSLPKAKLYTKPADDVVMLDALDVTEAQATKKMETISARLDAEKFVNVFSAEDFTKFSAGDVASALNRVAGVNVVKGQFAIIRGLEDRYSSTLYNGAAIPSPDPDSQSVQLDLFPSDVVTNLVIAKTFAGDLPGNSAGGSINIVTHDYPKELEVKVGASTGFNENAAKRFIALIPDNPIGSESGSKNDIVESDFGLTIGGREKTKMLGGRELRFKAVFSQETDFDTKLGVQEGREPRVSSLPRPGRPVGPNNVSGDLALGRLSLSDGRFELTDSTRSEQTNAYLGFGTNLDKQGNHKIDGSVFFTRKREEQVQLKENGFIPGYDYAANSPAPGNDFDPSSFTNVSTLATWIADARTNPDDSPNRGHLHFTNVAESVALDKERDLLVFQLNGSHKFDEIEDFNVSWGANQIKTTQSEEAFGVDYFYEPADRYQVPSSFPATPEQLGPGGYVNDGGITYSTNEITEDQNFGRLDADYSFDVTKYLRTKLNTGVFWEKSLREVKSSFLESPTVGSTSQFAIGGGTPQQMGANILPSLDETSPGVISGLRLSSSDAERDIKAFNLGSKFTLFRDLDLLGSYRFEDIFIQSKNDAFTGETVLGAPQIFPSRYLFLDRFDNVARGEVALVPPVGTTFNDQLLGVNVPVDSTTGLVDYTTREEIEALINGRIDEKMWLPALGFTYRATSRLTVRGSYSQTVARPSFRELGYYVSVDAGSNDLTVGNPQLKLSEVESFDLRVEYPWGDKGDLVAMSLFSKTIAAPIESIVVRDPGNFEGGGLYRTFFNNPNEATLYGIELEARKDLGFLGFEFADYFSLGGNVTYIKAEVDRTPIELARASSYFATLPGVTPVFTALEGSRRLYSQPEWIANLDVTFEHPTWGTTATLAAFAISDVLDAAGSATFSPNGRVVGYTLDRYIAEFYQVDLVVSQKWKSWTFRFSVKNLTDSVRKTIYDPQQLTDEVAERSYTVGRDYTLSASYQF